MTLELIDTIVRWLAGALAYTILGILLFGVWRGTRRQAGLTTGHYGRWLHSPWFYLVSIMLFFAICFLGWIPLPKVFSQASRIWMLALGCLLYFPGMCFMLWGRMALGRNYFVSSGFGAQLFAGHQLVTRGPFAIVRHPMYTGLFLAAFGSLLIYPTWTTLLFACFAPFIIVRAWREEKVLLAEFGEQWQDYCMRVPAFLPWLRR
jgi:protein-S-isoprenylcysteine O-methyltransferase Ste14